VYPASRLDWAVLGHMTGGTLALMPGVVGSVTRLRPHWLGSMAHLDSFWLMPVVLLGCLVALVWLCLSRAWDIAPFRYCVATHPVM